VIYFYKKKVLTTEDYGAAVSKSSLSEDTAKELQEPHFLLQRPSSNCSAYKNMARRI